MRTPTRAGLYGGLAVAVTSASFASILIRLAQPLAPSLVIAAWRLLLASLILWPIYLVRRRRGPESLPGRIVLAAAISGIFLALHFATWIASLALTTVASSTVLVATAPLFVAALSPLALREKVGTRLAAGLGLALLGVIVISAAGSCSLLPQLSCPGFSAGLQAEALRGNLLALAGALAAAFYLMLGRRVRQALSLIPYITISYSSAALVLLLFVLVTGLELTGYPSLAYLLFLLLAIFPQLIAHSTYNWALRHLAAATVAITLLGEPVGATMLAGVLLNEIPNLTEILGMILILAGIWIGVTGAPSPPQTAANQA
jgi:drug/metabolite transporter (DMT)-like permease